MRAPIALSLAAFALAGCAKFPKNASQNNFTRLVFRYTMAAPIDPNYIYVIAIRPIFSDSTQTDTNGPIPVVLTGSKNGFVEGWPTRFIRYDESVAELYNVYKFPKRTPTSDDDNPRNLAAQVLVGPVYANTGVDPRPINNGGSSYGRTLGFDIDTQYLADVQDGEDPNKIIAIQFNILTMNKTALNSVGDRVMDALGDTRSPGTVSFNGYQQRSILTSAHYFDQGSTDDEQPNDTYNGNLPAVDIVDWDLEVRPQ
jgi:hypothetical protein